MTIDYKSCVKKLEFDETYGFPSAMLIDCPNAMDEEHSFKVISFSPSATVMLTQTPTYIGTFEIEIQGKIYNNNSNHPIEGAIIHYVVVHSYFPEMHSNPQKEALSNKQGEFKLTLLVHDTDNIKIVAKTAGYKIYEQKLDFLRERQVDIGLESKSVQ